MIGFLWSFFKAAGKPPAAIACVSGPTGSMKTSLTLALTQLEGERIPKYPVSSTKAALEAAYAENKDAVAFFDDLKPEGGQSERHRLEENAEAIIRAFGDATGRKRNRDFNPSLRQYEAEGSAVLTGEYIPWKGSSLARVLVLQLKREDINIPLLTNIQAWPRLPLFVWHFLRWISMNAKTIIDFIAKERTHYMNMSAAMKFAHGRYRGNYVDLNTAVDLLNYYGERVCPDQPGWRNRVPILKGYIDQMLQYNMKLYCDESVDVTLCRAIQDGIIKSKEQFDALIVKEDADSYYVKAGTVYQWFKNYVKDNGINSFPFSAPELYKELVSLNVLEERMEGKQKRNACKYPGCGQRRCQRIMKEALEYCLGESIE